VPKLLDDQKKERVRMSRDFVAATFCCSVVTLDCIISLDETLVSYHTSATKKQSKQKPEKGKPGPIKA
jgi:hypothetical protein